jgi:hypothetical protein
MMTSAHPEGSIARPREAHPARPDPLPSRVPGAHGPLLAVPLRRGTARWPTLDPQVMERVRAALRRL